MNQFLAIATMFAALTVAYLVPAPSTATISRDTLAPIRSRLIDQLNAHRRSVGLPLLTLDPVAQRAAQYQAEDMELNGVMRHEDSNGRSPMTRYSAFGGRAALYGENVAFYGDTRSEAELQWRAVEKLDGMMMSEKPPADGHRENILSPNYRAVGIGVATGANGLYIAEDFVSPAGSE